MMNDTKNTIRMLAIEATKPGQTQHRFELEPDEVFNVPLSWVTNQTQIYTQFQSQQEVNALLFKNLADTFDPRIVKPFKDHSKVIKLASTEFVSADIYFLKTKTLVGQFLIAFHPVLSLTNLLFTDLALTPRPVDPASERKVLRSNTTTHLYELNPYDTTDSELGANHFQLAYTEQEGYLYLNRDASLRLSKLEANSVVGYQEGLFIDLRLEDTRDQDAQHVIYVVFERQ